MSRRHRPRAPEKIPAASPPVRGARRPTPRWLLAAVTILSPVLLLALAEGGLRLAGYGRDLEPVFVDAPGLPGWRQANPRAVQRLFADPADAPSVSVETAFFRAEKPAGAFRLVVQGESTTAGFPYGLGASLAGALEQRLRRTWPEREIEVISTAMAAVNSYALLDFADDILAEQPDAVAIYVGHNEYLGILGVGSTLRIAGSPWLTRAILAVRELRLYQAMHALLRGAAGGGGPSGGGEGTLMARVAGERSIPLDSPLYRRGLAQFERNLDALLATYQRAGVDVFIGTLVSNERDQPPFAGSEARERFGEAQRALAAGEAAAARGLYREARDLDELRFRAPSAFEDVIRRVAERRGATVVETQARLASGSPDGIIGRELMLEHVHPNLDGYFLLADAFYGAILAGGRLGAPAVEVPDDVARRELPVSAVDRWLGEYKLLKIMAGWPFTDSPAEPELPPPATEAERLAQLLYRERTDWPRAQDALRAHYREAGDAGAYTHVTQILAEAFPTAASLQYEAAAALIGQGRTLDALRHARRAASLAPAVVNHWLVMGHALALLGRDAESADALRRALELEPGNATATAALAALEARAVPSGP